MKKDMKIDMKLTNKVGGSLPLLRNGTKRSVVLIDADKVGLSTNLGWTPARGSLGLGLNFPFLDLAGLAGTLKKTIPAPAIPYADCFDVMKITAKRVIKNKDSRFHGMILPYGKVDPDPVGGWLKYGLPNLKKYFKNKPKDCKWDIDWKPSGHNLTGKKKMRKLLVI